MGNRQNDFVRVGMEDKINYSYYRIPKLLLTDERFKGISDRAILIYSILLNRVSLSKKNGWVDKDGNVYVMYSRLQMQETLSNLHVGINQIGKYYKELSSFGLIDERSQGFNKAPLVYVKNFQITSKDSTLASTNMPFIKENEADNFSYYEFPAYFLTEEPFTDISLSALLLYIVLLDRTNISRKYNICDEDGELFVTLQHSECEELFGWERRNTSRIYKSLQSQGLIDIERAYGCKENRIYVYKMADILMGQNGDYGWDKTVITDGTKRCLRMGQNSDYGWDKTVFTDGTKQCTNKPIINKPLINKPLSVSQGADGEAQEIIDMKMNENLEEMKSEYYKAKIDIFEIQKTEINNVRYMLNHVSQYAYTSSFFVYIPALDKIQFDENKGKAFEAVINLIQAVYHSPDDATFSINKEVVSKTKLCEVYAQLAPDHILAVIKNISDPAFKPKKPIPYIRSMLYNIVFELGIKTTALNNFNDEEDLL